MCDSHPTQLTDQKSPGSPRTIAPVLVLVQWCVASPDFFSRMTASNAGLLQGCSESVHKRVHLFLGLGRRESPRKEKGINFCFSFVGRRESPFTLHVPVCAFTLHVPVCCAELLVQGGGLQHLLPLVSLQLDVTPAYETAARIVSRPLPELCLHLRDEGRLGHLCPRVA